MERPTRHVFALAGSPSMPECSDVFARCVVCATESARTMVYERWQGSTFTDQNKLRGHGLSDRVCESCVWVHSWVAPPDKPANPPGTKGLNLRLFSHVCDGRGYRSLHKGEKPAIRDWLRSPKVGPWWCAIADTGQKHVLPWTRANPPGARGVVRFEERDVSVGDWSDVDAVTSALTAGVTKEEIATGHYTSRAWTLAEALVRDVEARAVMHRGGGWWALVVWLAQRDEEAVADRLAAEKTKKSSKKERANGQGTAERGSARRRGGARDGDEGGVPGKRRVGADALGSTPRPASGGDAIERDDRDPDHGVAAGTPSRGAQLGLFGRS